MSTAGLPSRLRRNVLVDVVFELRFDAQQGFSELVPGGARSLFGTVRSLERTAMAELPHQMREMDPNLKFQPTMRMVWDDVVLIIGDHSLGIGFGMKYPGWSTFKQNVNKLLDWISTTDELASMVEQVNRYSFKYLDFIPLEFSEGIESPYEVDISVGGESMYHNPLKLQLEKKEDFGTALIEFSHPVQAQIENKAPQLGTLISIDTVRFLQPALCWNEFIKDINHHIDLIHEKNKEYFFNFLSKEILERLEPEYD